MKQIKNYKMVWNTEANEGILVLDFGDDKPGQVLVDSPAEASLLLDILRNEQPVYFQPTQSTILTGLEAVGEGEAR